jgi:hypothetical protein
MVPPLNAEQRQGDYTPAAVKQEPVCKPGCMVSFRTSCMCGLFSNREFDSDLVDE